MGGGLSSKYQYEDEILVTAEDRLSMATRVNQLTKQSWCLKPESLDFFCILWSENESCCLNLIDQLNRLCDKAGRALSLKGTHIDTVIAAYDKLQQLPENITSKLQAYLNQYDLDVQSEKCLDIETVMQNLRVQHGPALEVQAKHHHLQHHTVYHALEIKRRAMWVINNQLSLLATHSNYDIFLCELISFFLEFHDHEQKDQGTYASVEHATATRVTTWVLDALNLPNRAPELIPMIEVVADWIIVLGSTMVWGPSSTMDLSELFFLFDEASTESGMDRHHVSNHSFIQLLGIIALVTGVCDKNPASIKPLMKKESEQVDILRHLESPVILKQFLESEAKPLYFKDTEYHTEAQAWLTTWAPHMNMRAELSVHDPAVSSIAIELIQLLTTCQKNRASGFSPLAWFHRENLHEKMKDMLETLFFVSREKEIDVNGMKKTIVVSGIQGEINFSTSQVDTLIFTEKKLPHLLFLLDERNPEEARASLGIEPTVPLTDAHNMERFGQFYSSCSDTEKAQLTQELFLVAALQIGTEYALLPELSYQSDILPQDACRTFSEKESERTARLSLVSSFHSSSFKENPTLLLNGSIFNKTLVTPAQSNDGLSLLTL